MNRKTKSILLYGLLLLIVDQFIKIVLSNALVLNKTYLLIKNLLYIKLVYNTGAAFSILEGNRLLLICIGIFALVFILFTIKKEDNIDSKNTLIYSLLIGGLLGNLVDRIVHGYVIDYIGVNIFGYSFPIFNLADTFITVSILILLLFVVKGDLWKE